MKLNEPIQDSFISIHAPAKGATDARLNIYLNYINFNPRSREGSDHIHHNSDLAYLLFQSTLPRRERRNKASLTKYKICISIHAPAKGATVLELVKNNVKEISIHAPAKGATFGYRAGIKTI